VRGVLLGMILFCVSACGEEEPYVRVNGTDYHRNDLERFRKMVKLTTVNRLGSKRGPERTRHLRRMIKDEELRFLSRICVLQDAEKAGVTASEEEILEVKNRIADSLRQLQASLDELAREAGFSAEEFELALREQTIAEKRIKEVVGPATELSDEELREIYEEKVKELSTQASVRIQFVRCDIEDEEDAEQVKEARQRAERLRTKVVQDKQSFDTILGESDDPRSRDPEHPNLFYVGMMEQLYGEEVEKAAFEMEPGDVSEPIRGKGGYYLVHVFHKEEPNVPAFEAVKDTLRRREMVGRKIKETASYRTSLREEAEIVYPSKGPQAKPSEG